jgi:hypothetical protein
MAAHQRPEAAPLGELEQEVDPVEQRERGAGAVYRRVGVAGPVPGRLPTS